MATPKNDNPTRVVTGLVRFSYPHVYEPQAAKGSTEKKYSVSLVIPKSDKAQYDRLLAAQNAAIEQGKTDTKLGWGGKKPAKLLLAIQDGDVEKSEDEVYADSWYISAKSKTKPTIVDKDLNPIMEQDEFYAGCYGRASINFYPYDVNGSKGIAVGLNNIQKLKDGEALGGGSRAEDDFAEPLDIDDDLM